jgi:hypothetical protein
LCDRFRWHYNPERPHQSLNQQVPAEKYRALTKVTAGDPRPRRRKSGSRLLRVSSAGNISYRKRKIVSGHAWTGKPVIVIETGPDQIVVLEEGTGSVLRELTVGPEGTYHPSGKKRPITQNRTPAEELIPSAMS